MNRLRTIFLSFLLIILLIIIAVAGAGFIGVKNYFGDGPLAENKLVLIERGSGVSAIANTLKNENIIAQPLVFKLATRVTGSGSKLKAGEYEFPAGISMEKVISLLEAGKTFDRKVTIREGLTNYQVVKLLNAREDMTGVITAIPPEGMLLPETYHYTKDQDRQKKINEMAVAMKKTVDELWEGRAEGLPIKTKKEALILASIVEKETAVPSERKKVAGVFINRLNKKMLLQTDPTVIYAITKGKIQDEGKGPLGRRLLRKDLKIDSPYNTYKYAGLPPGPIANPGKASIEAVLNPEKHEYIFFVADGTGGHAFGKTLAEHNKNVANWRKVRK